MPGSCGHRWLRARWHWPRVAGRPAPRRAPPGRCCGNRCTGRCCPSSPALTSCLGGVGVLRAAATPPPSSCPACRTRTAGRARRGSPAAPRATGRRIRPALRTVVTSRPSAWAASTVQDFTDSPSSSTVHAPQEVVSQPMLVAVKPATSRTKCASSNRSSTSASTCAAVDADRDLHRLALASLIAAHTRSGVAGMSMCRTPRWDTASMTAFSTAGVDPMVPASPIPLAPSGLMRGRGLAGDQLERGKLGRGDRRVVDQRAGQRVAVGVVAHLFQQRLRDALGDSAVPLALGQHRVEYPPGVVHGDVPHQGRLAGLGVHLHHRQVRAERERRRAGLEARVGGQAVRPGRARRSGPSPAPTPGRRAPARCRAPCRVPGRPRSPRSSPRPGAVPAP